MRRNKMLALAMPVLVTLIGMVVYEYGYLGVRSELAQIKEQQDAKMKTLEKYIAAIAEKPELEKRLASLKEKVKANNAKFIEGEPVSLASANLQEMVKGMVTGRGGTISSERIGKPEDFGAKHESGEATAEMHPPKVKAVSTKKEGKPEAASKIKVISVSIDATLPDPGALSDVLYSIETRTPYLILKELDARVRNFKEPRDLMVKMDISSLYEGK
jgi:hypothetical protein